jgi:hypothetical protein
MEICFGGYQATELSHIPRAVLAPNPHEPDQKARSGATEPSFGMVLVEGTPSPVSDHSAIEGTM